MTNEQAAKEYADKYPELFDDKTRERMYKGFLAGCTHMEGMMEEFAHWCTQQGCEPCGIGKWHQIYTSADDEREYTNKELIEIFKQQKGY